jgi:tellurite resistance protein
MNTYRPAVLEYDPAAAARTFEAAYQGGIKRVMVRTMLADGSIDEEELQLIRGVFLNLAGRALEPSELEAEIAAARRDPVDVAASLRELAGMLNDRGKTAVYKAAYLVAAANGTIDRAETELLNRVSQALGLTTEQAQQAVRELNEPAAR